MTTEPPMQSLVPTRRMLMRHQIKASLFAKRRRYSAGIFMAPGTGKTITAIRLASPYPPALILCRRDDFKTWRDELGQEGYSGDSIRAVDSGEPALLEPIMRTDYEGSLTFAGWPSWWMVTYDLLKNPNVLRFVMQFPFRFCIADESHSIKRYESKRTRTVIKATRHIPCRLALTGTPITNELRDVWSQAMFIDGGRTFGDKERDFLLKHYIRVGHSWYLKRGAKEIIQRKLASLAFHVHEDDVLTLPPVRRLTKAVPASGMQRRHYERVIEEWELELADGRIMELNQVVVQLTKLRQIASGFYYMDDEARTPIWFRSHKLDLLTDLITDPDALGRKPKLVIWCAHTAEILKISEVAQEWGLGYVQYYGAITGKNRDLARTTFAHDPACKLFIAQVDAGVGMNELVVADTAVYFSNSFRVVSRQQSLRRIRRRGSERHSSITYYDLVTEGTIDEPLLRGVERSMSLATTILTALKKGQSLRAALS